MDNFSGQLTTPMSIPVVKKVEIPQYSTTEHMLGADAIVPPKTYSVPIFVGSVGVALLVGLGIGFLIPKHAK